MELLIDCVNWEARSMGPRSTPPKFPEGNLSEGDWEELERDLRAGYKAGEMDGTVLQTLLGYRLELLDITFRAASLPLRAALGALYLQGDSRLEGLISNLTQALYALRLSVNPYTPSATLTALIQLSFRTPAPGLEPAGRLRGVPYFRRNSLQGGAGGTTTQLQDLAKQVNEEWARDVAQSILNNFQLRTEDPTLDWSPWVENAIQTARDNIEIVQPIGAGSRASEKKIRFEVDENGVATLHLPTRATLGNQQVGPGELQLFYPDLRRATLREGNLVLS